MDVIDRGDARLNIDDAAGSILLREKDDVIAATRRRHRLLDGEVAVLRADIDGAARGRHPINRARDPAGHGIDLQVEGDTRVVLVNEDTVGTGGRSQIGGTDVNGSRARRRADLAVGGHQSQVGGRDDIRGGSLQDVGIGTNIHLVTVGRDRGIEIYIMSAAVAVILSIQDDVAAHATGHDGVGRSDTAIESNQGDVAREGGDTGDVLGRRGIRLIIHGNLSNRHIHAGDRFGDGDFARFLGVRRNRRGIRQNRRSRHANARIGEERDGRLGDDGSTTRPSDGRTGSDDDGSGPGRTNGAFNENRAGFNMAGLRGLVTDLHSGRSQVIDLGAGKVHGVRRAANRDSSGIRRSEVDDGTAGVDLRASQRRNCVIRGINGDVAVRIRGIGTEAGVGMGDGKRAAPVAARIRVDIDKRAPVLSDTEGDEV